MPFGTVIKSVSSSTAGIGIQLGSSAGMETNGRNIILTGSSSTIIYALTRQTVTKAYTVAVVYIHPHHQEGHRNTYIFNAVGSTNIPQRIVGTATNIVRSGGANLVFHHMMGRRVFASGVLYDHINRANLRVAPTAGLTTPLVYCATDRYYYVIHNTNQLVKIHRVNNAIVASCTLPANGAVTDGICSDDRNIIWAAGVPDTIYLMRAA